MELERTFHLGNSGVDWTGIPVVAANMDTVGTFSMARVLGSQGLVTAIHKHYSSEQWYQFANSVPENFLQHVMVSTGTGSADREKLDGILKANPGLKHIMHRCG